MKKKEIPIPLLTGQYVTADYSHTLHTEYDASERDIVAPSVENYGVNVAGYMPLGVTDEWITFEGENAAQKFLEHFGTPNILAYGSAGSWAYQALLSGFRVSFLNGRLPDATYPNMYLGFDIGFSDDEDSKFKFYGYLNSSTSTYSFAVVKEDLPEEAHSDSEGANIKEFSIPGTIIELKPYTVEDTGKGTLGARTARKNGFAVAKYLKEQFEDTISSSEEAGIVTTEKFHLPIIGLFYRGRGSFGNVYKCSFRTSPNTVSDKYPLFSIEIKNQSVIEHKFDFTFFDIPMYNVNMGFGDQATENCKLVFTSTNSTDKFRSYMVTRRDSLKIGPALTKLESKIKATIIAEIKKQFTSFDEGSSTHDLDLMFDEINEWKGLFPAPAKASAETHLSMFNPFEEHGFSTPQPVEVKKTNSDIPLSGGKDGVLGEVLEEGEFDWKSEATVEGIDGGPTKVWEWMLNEIYSGRMDDSLFDPRMVRDSLIIADAYPESVQKTINDLVKYRENEFNYDKSRPDMACIMTPDESVVDIETVFTWARSLGEQKNMSLVPNVGRFRFMDPTTGAQVYLSGYYSYFGTNGQLYNYLTSGTTDPFASGAWSIINKAARNSEELIPSKAEEYTQLTQMDITYYVQQSNGLFKLGLDSAYNPGKTTVLKNIGYIINANRIKNITYLILRDNRILDPTSVNLTALQDLITSKIAPYTKIFKGRVETKVSLSEHPQEMGKYIILADTHIYGDHFSTKNRSQVTIHDAAELSTEN